jgi:MFS family permease
MKSATPESTNTLKSRPAWGIRHTFDALGNEQFRLLWFGMLAAQGAMQMNIVNRAWLAYTLSGSALALGAVSLAQGLPWSILSLLGGAIADRVNKRNLLILVMFSLSALAITNALLIHLKVIRIWHLVVIGLFQGTIFAFNMPARQALIPEVVGDDLLSNALALNATGMNLNRVFAPSLAGLLIGVNPALSFDLVAACYCASALLLLRLPSRRRKSESRSRSPFLDIADGVAYMFRDRTLLVFMVMAFVPVFVGMPYRQLLPVFQQTVLHVGPRSLGLMYTAVGIGALVGSLTVASLAASPRKVAIQGVAGVLFGLFLMMFALSPSLPVSLGMLVLVGLASQGYMTINSVLLMEAADPAYYGRVMSIYMITFSMMPVAMLPIGFLVDQFGAPATEAVAGIVLAGLMLMFLSGGRRVIAQGRRRDTK